ncbi:MAG: divergent PAP2 family protein [bacterium]
MLFFQSIFSLLSNKVIIGTLLSSVVAQLLKIVIMGMKNRKLDFSYAFSMSGMPSGHTSGIVALSTLIGLKAGFDSVLFAFAFCMAVVIMYDAVGVRQQAGKHAEMLNYLLDKYTVYANEKEDKKKYLKVRLGHTVNEVIGGVVNGLVCALVFSWVVGI